MVERTTRGASRSVGRDIHRTHDSIRGEGRRNRGLASADTEDVIRSLSNAPENVRARQIGEWESLRKATFRAAV